MGIGSLDIIIGNSSQTGSLQQAGVLDSLSLNLDKALVATSRKKSIVANSGNIQILPGVGVDLSEKTIQNSLGTIGALTSNLGVNGELQSVNIFMHAMAMAGIDPNYPQKIAEETRKLFPHSTLNSLLISFDSDNSHFPYGAKGMKDTHVDSLLGNDDKNSKNIVLDLLVFDSPSAKVLGLTFIGVVFELINFINNTENNFTIRLKQFLKDYLGEDYNYILSFISKYPLSGDLSEGQVSLKSLSKKDFNRVLNEFTKKVNCGKLSLISGVLSKFYLTVAMSYLNKNQKNIFNKSGRLLLDWDTIFSSNVSDSLVENLFWSLDEITTPSNINNNGNAYLHIGDYGDFKLYKYDVRNLFVIGRHFGVNQMILLDNLVANSGLLADDERVLTDEGKTFIYAGENLALRRGTNKRGKPVIQIYDAEKKQTLLAEFEVVSKDTEIRYYQKQENETLYTYADLQAMKLDLTKYPHSDQWIYDFNKGIPGVITEIGEGSVNWVHIDKSSSVLEFLGFQIGKILDNVDLTSFNSKLTRELVDNMEGKFAKIVKSYISPNFDKLLSDTRNISIRLNKVSTTAGVVKFTLDLISGTEIAGSYEFNVM